MRVYACICVYMQNKYMLLSIRSVHTQTKYNLRTLIYILCMYVCVCAYDAALMNTELKNTFKPMHTHTHTQVYTLQYQLRMATKANNEYIIKDGLLRKKIGGQNKPTS